VKVYLNKPRSHWISPYTILERVFFWREIDYDEPIIVKLSDFLQPFSRGLQWFLDKVNPKIDYVKIDYWDTWSMDHTLSPIIHPMLIQLKNTKHGSPYVEDKDVPEELRSTSAPPKENEYDTDDNHHLRWDWVMDEMIWTFQQLSNWDHDSKFFDHSNSDGTLESIKFDEEGFNKHNERIQNGLRLFGRYYRGLWD
jgi:hypothetical protein